MPGIFSGPPKPPAPPKVAPPQNTALTAQLKAMQQQAGANAAVLTTGGGTPSTGLTHTLTGS